MTLKPILKMICILAGPCLADIAPAAVVSYNFSGVIFAASPGLNLPVGPGSPFVIAMSWDTETYGIYSGPGADPYTGVAFSGEILVGGISLSQISLGLLLDSGPNSNLLSYYDPAYDAFPLTGAGVSFYDVPAILNATGRLSLIQSGGVLGNLRLAIFDEPYPTPAGLRGFLDGDITSIEYVPEPSLPAMLTFAACFALRRRQRR